MSALAGSDRFQRGFMWIAALILVAGAVAFLTTRLGGDGEEASTPVGANPAAEARVDSAPTIRSTRIPRAARVAAGEFILAAAGREDLKKAWRLSHPKLKRECGCSYKEWLTGNIPVQYYPVDNLEGANFAIDEASPNHAILLVALFPKEGEKIRPQTFYIGLEAVREGGKKRWLVNYWAPYTVIAAPALPEG